MIDAHAVREDFPIFNREVNGKKLVYFDSAASAQKPTVVIDAVDDFYRHNYASVHRGIYALSNRATTLFENTREAVASFLGASTSKSIIFTRGATESLNLVAYAWLESQLAEDDEVIVTTLDHHSNIVPWHIICQKKKANLVWVECTSDGALSVEAITRAITNKTRLISVTQMSNVVGYIVDVQAIVEKAHAHGVAVVIDGTQAAVHMPVNVEEIGCDFYAITGHKLYGPSGCGALFIHPRRFSEMQPMQGGGNMIRNVSKDCITYNDLPHLLEAGTPPIAQIIGWKKAFDYLDDLGFVAVQEREEALGNLMEEGLSSFPWLKLHGVSGKRHTIFSFSMDQVHPHDIATVLDKKGIAVRAGHHCAQPLMKVMDVQSTCRASLAFYNTEDEINFFIEALEFCYQFFNRS